MAANPIAALCITGKYLAICHLGYLTANKRFSGSPKRPFVARLAIFTRVDVALRLSAVIRMTKTRVLPEGRTLCLVSYVWAGGRPMDRVLRV